MSLTKTHFIEIADVLDKNKASIELALDMADYFESVNPRFNRVEFLRASTVDLRAEARQNVDFLERMVIHG